MQTIGFIGLGIMGKPMAKNLIKAGYSLVVHNRSDASVKELVVAGAKSAPTAREVAAQSDVIITMLPNSPDVKAVCLGKDGIIEGAKQGAIVVDMSSIAPLAAQEVAAELSKKGVTFLDAPVSGGEPKAIEGTLAIMVGGPQAAFDEVKDILLKMGASATRVGEVGSGNVTKLANQIIVALNIAAVSEAMTLATKAGVAPENVFEAIRKGLAGSTVLEAKMPLMLAGNFKPGFRIELHVKDLNNVVETASGIGAPIPLTEQVLGFMRNLQENGHAKDDHGGLVQHYEKQAGVQVRKG